MKKFLFLATLLFFNFQLFAQGEANNWYFGHKAGITFNTTPPSVLYDGKLNTNEGCASISDRSGNLLFYTDGIRVWNRKHQLMPNGTGLLGNPSSSQSAIIVPRPGSSTNYYIITVPDNGGVGIGMRYSEVDISLADGFGDVLKDTKNKKLFAPTTEKVTVVKHSSGDGYWIVGAEPRSKKYYTFIIDCNGINTTPIISNVSQGIDTGSYGCIVASPDGKLLAMASHSKGIDLLNFDATTGTISHKQTLGRIGKNTWDYGVAFSPNSKVLYGTSVQNSTGRKLIQWDLSASDIQSTKLVLSENLPGDSPAEGGYGAGTIQLAPDQKIYVAQAGTTHLGVIEHPNNIGQICNYTKNAISLGDRKCDLGLPPFISSFFIQQKSIVTLGKECQDREVQFALTENNNNALKWNFGDSSSGTTNESTETNPKHTYTKDGNYTVKLVEYSVNCSINDTSTINIIVGTSNSIFVSNDTTICNGASVELKALGGEQNGWRWNTNDTNSSITVSPTETTTYSVQTKVKNGLNLIINGDFEQGNTHFTHDFKTIGNLWVAGVVSNPKIVDQQFPKCNNHTENTQTGKMLIVSTSCDAPDSIKKQGSVWSQKIQVKPNTEYSFSAWYNLLSLENPSTLKVFINDEELLEETLNGSLCDWKEITSTWTSGEYATATISIYETTGKCIGNAFALDDISLYQLCGVEKTVTVSVNKPEVSITLEKGTCIGASLGSAKAIATNGYVPYTYTWSNGESSDIATYLSEDENTVTIKDSLNCTASSTINIPKYSPPYILLKSIIACGPTSYDIEVKSNGTLTSSAGSLINDSIIANIPMGTTAVIVSKNGDCEVEAHALSPISCPDNSECPTSTFITTSGFCESSSTYSVSFYVDPPQSITASVGLLGDSFISGIPLGTDLVLSVGEGSCKKSVIHKSPSGCVTPCSDLSFLSLYEINCLGDSYEVVFLPLVPDLTISASQGEIVGNKVINIPSSSNIILTAKHSECSLPQNIAIHHPDPTTCIDTLPKKVSSDSIGFIKIPNSFTPNGDGKDELFVISNLPSGSSLHVYNNWGSVVYRSNDYKNNWNGTCSECSVKNKEVPTSTYYYVLELPKNNPAQKQMYKGFVYVSR